MSYTIQPMGVGLTNPVDAKVATTDVELSTMSPQN